VDRRLARQTVQYSSDPSLENVITATMNLEIEVLPVAGRGQTQKQLLTASGAGFKNEAARDMAMERLLKDIAKNPKLSRIVLAPPQ